MAHIFQYDMTLEKKLAIPGIKDYHDDIPNEYIIYEIKQHIKQLTDKNIFIKLDYNRGMPPKIENPSVFTSYIYPETLYFYHSHNFYEMNVIFSGKCVEYIDNTPVYLETGDVLIMRPDTVYHSAYAVKGTNAINILIPHDIMKRIISEFEKRTANVFSEFMKNYSYCIIKGFTTKMLSNALSPLSKIYSNTSERAVSHTEDLIAEHTFKLFLLSMQRQIDIGKAYCEYSDSKRVSVHSADTIVRYIKEHYTDISMDKLVKKFGYSKRQLYRMVLNHTGNNFQTLVMYHKLQRARQLLEATDLSVKEICEIIGYESPEYFCRLFKRETYRTPLEYREERKS